MEDHAAAMNIAAAAAASIQALAEALQQQHISQPPQQRISLPTFWKEDPRGWFHHIEAEFTIARVPLTSYHCYLHIIRALPADIIAAVHDLIRTITEETPNAYEVIKAALLRRFTATPLQQSHKLLDYAQLGDGNIAVHYAQMRALYTPNSDVLFNAIFLRTLPENVRTALASQAELPSDELAHAAIQLQHTVVPTASIAAATPIAAASPAPPSRRNYKQSPYRQKSYTHGRRPHSRDSRSRSASGDRRRRSSSRDSGRRRLCWYHESFGKRAKHCNHHECDWEN
jgi:hypothetical protein